MTNFASDDFLNEVKSVHWEEVFPAQADASVIFDSFHAKITEIVDKHVPLKKYQNDSCCCPQNHE